MIYPTDPYQRRFGAFLLLSAGVHLFFLWWLGMHHDDRPLPKKGVQQVMDVVLLDDSKVSRKKAPDDAKVISNRNAVGGSKARDRVTRAAKAPVQAVQRRKQAVATPSRPVPQQQRQQQQRNPLLTRKGGVNRHSVDRSDRRKPVEKAREMRRPVPLSNLMPSSMALAELSRDFQRERRMKQKLSREADIPINTRKAKYAPYAQALVRALEEQWRPGQANYAEFPEEQRRSVIKLTIEKGGELSAVVLVKPSPVAEVNNSAIEAIHAAAPFKVLPSSWGLDRVSFYLTFEVVDDKFVFHSM